MRIEKENVEKVFEALKNIVGVSDCLDAIVPDGQLSLGDDDFYEDVEIEISSCQGEGSFCVTLHSNEISLLSEALFGISSSLKYKLNTDLGVSID